MKLPNIPEFLECVNNYEEIYAITECVYRCAIERFKDIRLCDLSKEHSERILRPFFLTWGVMTRVLGYAGCERICETLKASTRLEGLREKDLVSTDLEELAEEITELYETMKNASWKSEKGKPKTVGSTSAAKALHLAAPKLFMMWDRQIRDSYEFKESGAEYLRFLLVMQKWLRNLESEIRKLQHQYNKSACRLLDEYNWMKVRD